MFRISKQFAFCASHQLKGLPEGHKCGRLHGHNYRVEVILEAETLNEVGFIIDYGDLVPFKNMLDDRLDHRHLNDLMDFQTSAEMIAEYFYSWCIFRWPQTIIVRVSETPKTWAEYHDPFR